MRGPLGDLTPAAMEPAGDRWEHHPRVPDAAARHRPTAMEPALERREHGSQFPGRLTCANRSWREHSGRLAWRWGRQMDLSRCGKHALTRMRALPRHQGHHLGSQVR